MESDLVGELRGEMTRVAALVEDLRQELAGIMLAAAGDAPDDEHDVEGSSIGFERARVTALLAATEQRQAALSRALTAAANGVEVRCATCGQAIDPERLSALPGTTTCVACAGRRAGPSR
jgi:DnaK suppressor protein